MRGQKQYALNTDYSLFMPVFPDFKPLNQREMAPACFRLISTFVPWSSVFLLSKYRLSEKKLLLHMLSIVLW